MLLASQAKPALISGKTVATEFGIGNAAILIHYMTTTIYSNKPKAVCQEIMSNARDAHREVGTPDRPIRVKVPNGLSPSWECQDYGPGMDPERIVKVFTQYCNSTKRTDNLQTGGFGIGGKTPFAYADTFTIRTIAKENGVNTLRNYVAIKEGDAGPRLMECGEPQETQEDTGTTISVPINPDDFSYFTSYTFKVSQFWEVRPIVDGTANMAWEEYKWHYQGANWKIGNSKGYYQETHACIDGIPYVLNTNEFNNIADNLRNILRQNLVLFFKVGDLAVTLNRESLDYNEKTKTAIKTRLEEIQAWLENEIGDAISNASDLWQAHLLYRKLNTVFRISNLTKNVLWNNIKIDGEPMTARGVSFRSYKEKAGKLRNEKEWSLTPEEDQVMVYNDTGLDRVDIRRIYTLRDAHPDEKIFLIHPCMTDMTPWKTAVHWDLIKDRFVMLSTILPKKISRGGAGGPRTYAMTDCQQYIQASRGFYNVQNPLDYKNGGGIYIPTFRGKVVEPHFQFNVNKAFDTGLFTNESVYKIPARYVEKLGKGWIPYTVAIKKAYDAYVKTVPKLVKALQQGKNTENALHNVMNNSHYVAEYFKNNLSAIVDGKIKTWYEESIKAIEAPDVTATPDMAAFVKCADAANVNLDYSKGVDTLKLYKDGLDSKLLNLISAFLYRVEYASDMDQTLILETVNFLLAKADA
jgi:hypothetical protein